MCRITSRTLLSFLFVAAFSLNAEAKDPFDQLGDLLGAKIVQVHHTLDSATGTKQKNLVTEVTYQKLEFVATSGEDLLAIDGYQAFRVTADGYGSGHFTWAIDGDIYEIAQYPYGNDHAPVSGVVHHADGASSKFYLSHRKSRPAIVSGRWSGELAFPGQPTIGLALNVANAGDANPAYTRVDVLGFPSQPATTIPTEDGYYTQFLFWNEQAEGVFFVTLTGTVSGSEIYQGQATAWNLYTGGYAEGKFLTFRPTWLSL